ncbi:MAG: trypsin-like serine protease [Trueperaceae bacterium]
MALQTNHEHNTFNHEHSTLNLKKWRNVLVLVLLSFVLAACADNETPTSQPPESTPTPDTPATTSNITLSDIALKDGATLTSELLKIEGSIADESTVSLSYSLNGAPAVDVSSSLVNQAFSFDIDLGEPGEKALELRSVNGKGESSSLALSFTYTLTNPTIILTEPASGTFITEPLITVKGTASDDQGISTLRYKLNGGEIVDVSSSLQEGAFSFDVNLEKTGEQILELTATDTEGNTGTVNLTVVYATNGIAGTVYDNLNGDGIQTANELGLPDWTVYLDKNNNGKFDEGEPSTQTDESGTYVFPNLSPGDYTVRQVLPFGWRNTAGGTELSALAQNIAAMREYANRTFHDASKGAKIVGGVDTDINQFPFMVAIGVATSTEFFQSCGGSLVSDSWVLTAAHCSVDEDGAALNPIPEPGQNLAVFVGSDTLSEVERVMPVSRILVHPSYKNAVETGYDFALWELAEPLELEDIYTVEMLTPDLEHLAVDNVLATATGWGTLASGGPSPDKLQVVHTPLYNSEQCLAATQKFSILENFDTQICAGVPEGGIDACQGDSGGPLLVRDALGSKWYHVGATSHGVGCANPGLPGIYARTSVLSDWAIAAATLSSRSYNVGVLKNAFFTNISFGNEMTTRPYEAPIEPRWQATNLTPDPQNPEADAPLTFSWNIIDEGSSTFECTFDADGEGTAATSTSVPCAEGNNSTSFSGYPQNLYLPTLTVSKNGVAQSREALVESGNPLLSELEGELTSNDPIDPNYPDTRYYIDYYKVTGLTLAELALISVEVALNDEGLPMFTPYLALYNEAELTPEGGPEIGGGLPLVLRAETNSYIIGITTFGEEEVGKYTVQLKGNAGTLEPFSF